MFSTQTKTEIILATFILLSAYAFSLVKSIFFSFGFEIKALAEKMVFWLIIIEFAETSGCIIFSSTGQRPASYCHGIASFVRLSVRPSVRPSINSSFKKLLLRNY